ncbi:SCO family protein [Thalassospiraceae bacterium LMO-SO8]|nr:SCO family protein [Alphaproteobacteria bacterium LMO-S08]WND75141.1 SCO family protein [Thalassospiraceae bacterium LMO-SO8]
MSETSTRVSKDSRRLRVVRWTAWGFVLITAMAAAGIAGWRTFKPEPPLPTARQLGQAMIKSQFTLTDHHGRTVTEQDFHGRWQLVFFGFTFCPDVCPTTLSVMAQVLDTLGDDAKRLAPLFITVDPERDTPEVLAEYVGAFHPNIVGLTGTSEQIKQAAKSFRIFYGKTEKAEAPGGYVMGHSGYMYLMTPEGMYDAVFSENLHPPEKIAIEIQKRLQNESPQK